MIELFLNPKTGKNLNPWLRRGENLQTHMYSHDRAHLYFSILGNKRILKWVRIEKMNCFSTSDWPMKQIEVRVLHSDDVLYSEGDLFLFFCLFFSLLLCSDMCLVIFLKHSQHSSRWNLNYYSHSDFQIFLYIVLPLSVRSILLYIV